MRIEMEKKQEQEEEARKSDAFGGATTSSQGYREDVVYPNYQFDPGFSYPTYPYQQAYDPHFHQYDSFHSNFRYGEDKAETFSELLSGGRYAEGVVDELHTQGQDENQSGENQLQPVPSDKPQEESDSENFGEIIKKTMVESATAWNTLFFFYRLLVILKFVFILYVLVLFLLYLK